MLPDVKTTTHKLVPEVQFPPLIPGLCWLVPVRYKAIMIKYISFSLIKKESRLQVHTKKGCGWKLKVPCDICGSAYVPTPLEEC